MPPQDTKEYLEIARQFKKEGIECYVVCKGWDQHGHETGQCEKSTFVIYRGPGPKRTHSKQTFKVATKGDWWCPKFKRKVID